MPNAVISNCPSLNEHQSDFLSCDTYFFPLIMSDEYKIKISGCVQTDRHEWLISNLLHHRRHTWKEPSLLVESFSFLRHDGVCSKSNVGSGSVGKSPWRSCSQLHSSVIESIRIASSIATRDEQCCQRTTISFSFTFTLQHCRSLRTAARSVDRGTHGEILQDLVSCKCFGEDREDL